MIVSRDLYPKSFGVQPGYRRPDARSGRPPPTITQPDLIAWAARLLSLGRLKIAGAVPFSSGKSPAPARLECSGVEDGVQ
jgi:hypothetical protein